MIKKKSYGGQKSSFQAIAKITDLHYDFFKLPFQLSNIPQIVTYTEMTTGIFFLLIYARNSKYLRWEFTIEDSCRVEVTRFNSKNFTYSKHNIVLTNAKNIGLVEDDVICKTEWVWHFLKVGVNLKEFTINRQNCMP